MTDLRAKRIAIQWSQGFPVTMSEKEARSYHKKMLELLQEREGRARGCEFCKGINEPMQFYEYGSDDRGILFDEIKTFYCPRCGRPLKGGDNETT